MIGFMGGGRGGHGGMQAIAQMEAERPKNRSRVFGRLLKLLVPYRLYLVAALVLVILSAASQGAAPFLIGRAVDKYIGTADKTGLGWTMVLLIAVYAGGMLATRFQILALNQLGQKLLADLRQSVFDKIESLSLQFLESSQAGELMSRLVNDIDALNNFFSQGLAQMVGMMFSLLGIVVAMLTLNWKLGIAVIMMVPILFLTTRYFSGWARNAFRKTRQTLGDVSSGMEEELGGVKVAQAFNRTDENIRRFAERNAANRDANVNANAATSAFAPAMDILGTVDTALVATIGGAMVISGSISVGVVVAFLQYVQNFFRPIQQVASLWAMAQSAFAAAERVFDLLDKVPDIQDAPGSQPIGKINGQVEFDNVTFAYEKEAVLCNVSFTAKPGQTIAIVGPTGAGKTTLVGLITRFYDATAGKVLIDGKDVRSITQHSLRSQVGLVTQEPFLFSGTILENIRYGRLEASDEEVIAAASAAHADDFITRLPNGYQTDIGERGKLLSQGQRQLVSIARAILANPRLLIMDEATANIDTRTEVIIQKALQTLLKGRTSFVIAHRLSTIRNANEILVVDDGSIVERGSHNELIAQNGLYADLYNRQFYQPA